MADEQATQEIVEYIKSLPPGSQVAWWHNHTVIDDKYSGGWIDVLLNDGGALKMNWVWTVEPPESAEGRDYEPEDWTITLAYDFDLWTIWSPIDHWYTFDPYFVRNCDEGCAPDDLITLEAKVEQLKNTDYEHDWQNRDKEKFQVASRSVWKLESVSKALEAWCTKYAGRGDLSFYYKDNGPSKLLQKAKEAYDAIQDGTDPGYEIGETNSGMKIMASNQVMDTLLNLTLTDEALAEKLMGVIRDLDANIGEITDDE